jgi:ectoine hydroxylase-related dioxygenase (phytanoyl-CoA dioxygenase family)
MSVGDLTEEHTDYYRFEHFAETAAGSDASASASADTEDGARHMFTCWLPLGHYTTAHGTLAVAEGSHRLSGYKRGVYGSSECKDELPPDFARWIDGDAASGGGVWRTADFAPGDVVVFDIRLVHASTANTRPHFRLSMDTRWKPTALVLDEQREAFRALPMARDVSDSQAP